jgi:hypothetical protein
MRDMEPITGWVVLGPDGRIFGHSLSLGPEFAAWKKAFDRTSPAPFAAFLRWQSKMKALGFYAQQVSITPLVKHEANHA